MRREPACATAVARTRDEPGGIDAMVEQGSGDVTQPPHVAVNEVLIRPTDQER